MPIMNRLLLLTCALSLLVCSSAMPGDQTTEDNTPCDCPQMSLGPDPGGHGQLYICAHFETSCQEIPGATTLTGEYSNWPYMCDNCFHRVSPPSDTNIKESTFAGLEKKYTPLEVPPVVPGTENRVQRLTEEFIRVRHPVTRKEHIAKLFVYALTVPEKPDICTKHVKLIHVAYEVENIPDIHNGLPVPDPKLMTDVIALPGNLALSVNDGNRVSILVLLAKPQ